jgi:hypothetical protein
MARMNAPHVMALLACGALAAGPSAPSEYRAPSWKSEDWLKKHGPTGKRSKRVPGRRLPDTQQASRPYRRCPVTGLKLRAE